MSPMYTANISCELRNISEKKEICMDGKNSSKLFLLILFTQRISHVSQ